MILEPIVAAVITASVAGASAFIAYRNRQSERVKLTMSLYNQFFSLMEARATAWFWLHGLNLTSPTASYEELWRNESNKEKLSQLYKVAGFWFLVHELYRSKQLDKKLCRALFSLELKYWHEQTELVVEATRAKDKVFPQFFVALESTKWLVSDGAVPR